MDILIAIRISIASYRDKFIQTHTGIRIPAMEAETDAIDLHDTEVVRDLEEGGDKNAM